VLRVGDSPDWPVTTVARLRSPRGDAVLSQPRVGAFVSPDPGVRSAMVAASWFPESNGAYVTAWPPWRPSVSR
jgi:hypothetical protein